MHNAKNAVGPSQDLIPLLKSVCFPGQPSPQIRFQPRTPTDSKRFNQTVHCRSSSSRVCWSNSITFANISSGVGGGMKGTHARDFHSLFLSFFASFSLTQYVQPTFPTIFFEFPQIFKNCYYSTFWARVRSIPKWCCQKWTAKLSVVFVTAHFRFILRVLSEKVE
jgi:hypothetical protein